MNCLISSRQGSNYGETWKPDVYAVVLDGIKSVQEHKPIYVLAKEMDLKDIITKEDAWEIDMTNLSTK